MSSIEEMFSLISAGIIATRATFILIIATILAESRVEQGREFPSATGMRNTITCRNQGCLISKTASANS